MLEEHLFFYCLLIILIFLKPRQAHVPHRCVAKIRENP